MEETVVRKKVTFVGAGNTGGAMAEMMASRGYADVVLIDIMLPGIDGFELCAGDIFNELPKIIHRAQRR